MQATQDWQGADLASRLIERNRFARPFWNLLPDALMRPGLIEGLDRGTQDTMQRLLLQDEQVIETLAPHAAKEAFTDGIGPWRVIRRFEDLDAAACGHARETGAKRVLTIANEILRSLSIGVASRSCCAVQGIGRRARDPHMNHFARVQFDEEEGKQGAKEEVGDLQEITGPHILRMVVQESGPVLSSLSWGASMPHVLLDGAFANADASFEEFTTNPFCSPQVIIPCHLLDEASGLCGNLGCGRYGSGLGFPEEFEALAMPARASSLAGR